MTGDEGGARVFLQHSVAAVDQLLVGQNVLAILVEVLEIRGSLLAGPERLPAGWVVGDMNVHRNLQLRAFAPHGFEPGIVRVQALLTRQGAPLHARTFIGKLSDAAGALSI